MLADPRRGVVVLVVRDVALAGVVLGRGERVGGGQGRCLRCHGGLALSILLVFLSRAQVGHTRGRGDGGAAAAAAAATATA